MPDNSESGMANFQEQNPEQVPRITIGYSADRHIILDFGQPVRWIGLQLSEATRLIEEILEAMSAMGVSLETLETTDTKEKCH